MKLSQIHLGNIDAKNELLSDTPEERERFLESFEVPPNLHVDWYLKKQRYFVTGLKGTGKTALLRYLALQAEEESCTKTSFVLFKSDIDEDFRKGFTQAARRSVTDNNTETISNDDYEYVWRWFIYRKLVSLVENDGINLFQLNSIYSEFKAIVRSPSNSSEEDKGLLSLIPKIKRGNITISKDPSATFEFEWNDKNEATINFNSLVRKADEKFKELIPGDDSLNIYFDELELNYNSKKQYERDAKIIRDVIVTVNKINSISKSKHFKICIYSAIRSEVQSSVDSLGKEINKILSDFGTEIMWNRPGIDASQQPLLNIVNKRLRSSSSSSVKSLSDECLWTHYFPNQIQNKTSKEYILHNSWYRPRDIVRLLKTAQDQYPEEDSFKHYIFDAIRKKYSELSWVEITEELKSRYKGEEISSIKRLLYGGKQHFTFFELKERTEKLKEFYPDVTCLLENHNIPKILSDLYRVGAVGNINDGRLRFSFRGDHEILLEQTCFLHNALKAHLSAT